MGGVCTGVPRMAWWSHLLFFQSHPALRDETPQKEETPLVLFRRAIRQYFYDNFIDILYVGLSTFTYLYLGLALVTFFFESKVPAIFPNIIDMLSEPYLGALGIYVIVKEIERRRGKIIPRVWSELFAVVWFFFFVAASILILFSNEYHVSMLYKNVVTNALAAIIIRLGVVLR